MSPLDAPAAGPIAASPDGIDQPYWDGLTVGALRIPRCANCENFTWIPQWMCPTCHHTDFNWVEVPQAGTVYSWTRTWHAFMPELADAVPYVVVLVQLDSVPPVRLLGMLVGDNTDPRIGAPVAGVIQPPSERTSNLPMLRWVLA